MRGVKVPFTETDDVALLGELGKIPKAFPNSIIDSTWFSLTPPTGSFFAYGFIDSPLPTLPSNLQGAFGFDPAQDQVSVWNGSRWITFA
jgi:hypothetical protein